jgi:hypothetical protein
MRGNKTPSLYISSSFVPVRRAHRSPGRLASGTAITTLLSQEFDRSTAASFGYSSKLSSGRLRLRLQALSAKSKSKLLSRFIVAVTLV